MSKSKSRFQTCPVVTLDVNVQEPCESEAAVQKSKKTQTVRTIMAVGLSALVMGGVLSGCADNKVDVEECQDGDENCGENQPGTCDPEIENCETTPPTCDPETEKCEDDVPKTAECLAIQTADGDAGVLDILDIQSMTIEKNLTSISKDTIFAADENQLYMLNRANQNAVQILALGTYSTLQDFSLQVDPTDGDEPGANPYPMAIHGDVGFIPAYGAGRLDIVNLTATDDEDFIIKRIAIPPIGAFDGSKSDPAGAIYYDGVVYVLLQGINDSWGCDEGAFGQILAFDADNYEPANVFDGKSNLDLPMCNPFHFDAKDGMVYISFIGGYRAFGSPADDGGIVAVDLKAGTSTVLATEADVNDRDVWYTFAANDGDGLWVVLLNNETPYDRMDLHYFDLTQKTLGDTVFTGEIWGLAETDDDLFLSVRNGNEVEGAPYGIVQIDKSTKTVSDDVTTTSAYNRGIYLFEIEGDSCFDAN